MPLKATGDPGPPRIVEIQEKYSAVEGKLFLSSFQKYFSMIFYILGGTTGFIRLEPRRVDITWTYWIGTNNVKGEKITF